MWIRFFDVASLYISNEYASKSSYTHSLIPLCFVVGPTEIGRNILTGSGNIFLGPCVNPGRFFAFVCQHPECSKNRCFLPASVSLADQCGFSSFLWELEDKAFLFV